MTHIVLTQEQWDKVENHISKHNEEMSAVQTDIEWLKWAVRLIVGGTAGSVIASLASLSFQIIK